MIFQCLGLSGIILLIYGVLAYALTQLSSWYLKSLCIVGILCLAIFLFGAIKNSWQKNFLEKIKKNKNVRKGVMSSIYTGIVVLLFVVINIGSNDLNKKWDYTNDKVNTLSDQSLKIAGDLQEKLTMTAFFDGQNPAKPMIKNILDRYERASKQIQTSIVEPDKEKLLAEANNAKDGDILISYKGQTHITQDLTEQGITQSILKVSRTTRSTLCFTTGHGEMDIDAPEDTNRSLSMLKSGLENEGYISKKIDQINLEVPTDCNVVLVVSPVQQFLNAQSVVLDRYLTQGGKLIALLDPIISASPTSKVKKIVPNGLEGLLKKWGMILGQNIILEKHVQLLKGESIDTNVIGRQYGNHPIVDPLKGKQTVYGIVQSVLKDETFTGTTYELVKSLDQHLSWIETDTTRLLNESYATLDTSDTMGPVNFAMASEKEGEKKTKLVVFGDADFASNSLIQSYEFNYDMIINAINWVGGEVEKISIRPKKIDTSALELTPEQTSTVFYLTIITIPMLVLLFGINLWWVRKQRG